MSGWIGVDLDGTLARHYWPEDGPYDPYRIGEPVVAMVQRVKNWLAEGIEVKIFTARVGPCEPGFQDVDRIHREIILWTKKHIGQALEATATKDYMMRELWDDRAVRVIQDIGQRCCRAYL